jgi:ankyrin repeat protein
LCLFAASSTDAVQALLDRYVVVSDLRDHIGRTPLHLTARIVDVDLARKLVECGVDLEANSSDYWYPTTCSSIAVAIHNAEMLRAYLCAGANPNGLGQQQRNCLLLHDAVFKRNYECVILLAAGADVDARDDIGRTACHAAAENVHISAKSRSLVHAMLAAGADLDAEDCEIVDPQQVDKARREIAKTRLDFVRFRAMEVCIGLQSLRLDALQTCEILQFACGPLARLVAFHQWWKIATTVKHF